MMLKWVCLSSPGLYRLILKHMLIVISLGLDETLQQEKKVENLVILF